jgi:lipoprotein-anchoring transpeptidase ErfK/SrfK
VNRGSFAFKRGSKAALAAVLGIVATGVVSTSASANAHRHAVPGGVRIAGIRVGGLAPKAASAAVKAAFAKPLTLNINGTKVDLHPLKLATPYIDPAVGHALSASAGTNIHLVVSVHGSAVRATAASLARRFNHAPRNASLRFVGGKPRIIPDRAGTTLDRSTLLQRVVHALNANVRLPISVGAKTIAAKVTAASIGPVILINRSTNRLTLFHSDNKVWRVFAVATGQSIYPTPAGKFSIVVKWVNPWWYPPTQDAWAKGLSPVPPGPNNPLGTRWMGLTAPGVGIHGTDEPSSIGWNASHGCIRMQVVDSEWLFTKVRVGTTVFIV